MTVYTIPSCGKCKVLKAKLNSKGIEYEECQNVDKMQEMGLTNLPVLEINDELLSFEQALKFVNER